MLRLFIYRKNSMDFLLKVVKLRSAEKLPYGNVQSVAQFFYGGYSGTVVPAAEDVLQGRLGHSRHGRQLIAGYIPFLTELQYPEPHRFSYPHKSLLRIM